MKMFSMYFFKCLFILRERESARARARAREREREREREHMQGRGRERGRERIPKRLLAVSAEPNVEFNLTNPELMT